MSKLTDEQLTTYIQGKGSGHFWRWFIWSMVFYVIMGNLMIFLIAFLSLPLLLFWGCRIYISARINRNARSAATEYFRRHPEELKQSM